MNDEITFLFSLSIGIAAILGIAKYKRMDSSFHPFVYYACLALLMEIAVYLLMREKMYAPINSLKNIYSISEFFIWTWLFHKWGLFKYNNNVFMLVLLGMFVIWFSSLFIRGFFKTNSYYFIFCSFCLIFFSISTFNKVLVNDRKNLFKNSKFWICLGIIIFYTYFILGNVATLPVLKLEISNKFIYRLFEINIYSNFLVNLIYAIAVLWMPRKKDTMTLF